MEGGSTAVELSGSSDFAAPASFFTGREWRALFPSGVRPLANAVDDAEKGDIDAPEGLPEREPLTREALLSELGDTAAGFLVRLQFRLQPITIAIGIRHTLFSILWLTASNLMWLWNDGRFGQQQMTASTISTVLSVLLTAILPLSTVYRSSFGYKAASAGRVPPPASRQPATGGNADESGHAFAGIARFRELVRAEGGESSLLKHNANDPLCPCPLASCAGATLARAGHLRALDSAFRICFLMVYSVVTVWTSLVTFGPQCWSTWYAAALAALYLVSAFVCHWPNLFGRTPANIATLGLSLRLHQRAMTLVLRSMLRRYSELLPDRRSPTANDPSTPWGPAARPRDEPYLTLHAALAATWRDRLPFLASGTTLSLAFFGVFAVQLVINAAAGGCVTANALFPVVYLLYIFTIDVVTLAAANAQVSTLTEKVLDAAKAARTFLARAEAEGMLADPAASAAARGLANHAELLVLCADSGRFKGRLFGFAVDAGVARSLFVTAFTVGIGFVSLLKAAGLFFTMDAVCPTL
ncbi:hypothetical protein DFJ74DRAFT_692244 [Hyaloraphidium curvatum]|nr:hypothetical protein DFJ74DRAFT_692244 [Hyaloraphidium curvatum]